MKKSEAEKNANKYGYTIIAKPSNPFDKKNIKSTLDKIMKMVEKDR